MPPDRTPDQSFVREVVEPGAICLPCGEHERQVAWRASLGKALLKRDEQLLGNGEADGSANR